MFISILSTWFEHSSAHHKEIQLYQYEIWYMSLCIGDRLVCRLGWSAIQACILAGMCSLSGDSIVSIRHLVYVTLTISYAGLDGTSKPAYQTITYIEWHIPDIVLIKIESPDDEHMPASMQAWMALHPSLHTRRSPIQSDIYQISYWYNWISWWWAHAC